MASVSKLRAVLVMLITGLLFMTPAVSARADTGTAATWLSDQLDSADDDPSLLLDTGLGLVAAGEHGQARNIADGLMSQASELDPAVVAKLIILVRVNGEDPRTYGDVDLVQLLQDGTGEDGQVGDFGSAFGQAWAILAYNWVGADVPPAVMDLMVTFADPETGGFGYDDGTSFVTDVDTTAMAVMAMSGSSQAPSQVQSAAIDWLSEQQEADGSFPGFSPVNSTGLAAAALSDLGRDTAGATGWLEQAQNGDGGLPAELDGPSDLRATSQGILGLAGTGYATLGATSGTDISGTSSGSTNGSGEQPTAVWVGAAVIIGAVLLAVGVGVARRRSPATNRTGASADPADDGSSDSEGQPPPGSQPPAASS